MPGERLARFAILLVAVVLILSLVLSAFAAPQVY